MAVRTPTDRQHVLDIIRNAGPEGLSRSAIAPHLTQPLSPGQLRRMLQAMIDSGDIGRVGENWSARYIATNGDHPGGDEPGSFIEQVGRQLERRATELAVERASIDQESVKIARARDALGLDHRGVQQVL